MQKFEDLIAWQKARKLTMAIYKITKNEMFSRDFGLRDQIQRSAVSIMSNIAEGFERMGNAEFHRFLVVAKASCAELRSQLYVAVDVGYISPEQFDEIHGLANEVARIIGGLRVSVKKGKACLIGYDSRVFSELSTRFSVLSKTIFLGGLNYEAQE